MFSKELIHRLDSIKTNFEKWNNSLSDKEVFENFELIKEVNIKISRNQAIYDVYNTFLGLQKSLEENGKALEGETSREMIELIKSEITDGHEQVIELEKKIKIMLLPSSQDDNKKYHYRN